MNREKRAARAKARRKSMAIVKRGVKHTCSQWSLHGIRREDGLTPGEVQSVRKTARCDAPDGSAT